MTDVGTVRISHSPAQERYTLVLTPVSNEAAMDSTSTDDIMVGYLDYVSEPYQVVLTHTVIREQYSGHGYAAQLVQSVLEDIRATGKQVVPVCSYVQRFIARHPEYADLTAPVRQ